MRLLTQNIFDATVAVATGTAHSDYAVTNLNSGNPNKVFKTEAASATDIYLTIDLGVARTCDYILIGNRSWSGTLSVHVGTTGSDDGVDWSLLRIGSEDMTYTDSNEHHIFNSIARRYWRVRFESFADNTDWIGNIALGAAYDTINQIEFGNHESISFDNVSDSEISGHSQRTKIGDPFCYYNNMVIRNMTRAQMDTLGALFVNNSTGGLHNFFFSSTGFVAAATGTTNHAPMYYGQLVSENIPFVKISKDLHECNIGLYSMNNFYQDWTEA